MLTLTTSREHLKDIVSGNTKEDLREVSPYWTKRIVRLLGFGEGDEKTILYNLREGRPGAVDAEREVLFTAGGVLSAKARVKISIENRDGAEMFVLHILEIIEVEGQEAPEKVDGEVLSAGEVIGNPTAPAVRKIVKATGFCKYCNQARIIDAPEGLTGQQYNEIASEECDCDEAERQRERRRRMEAAGEWAKNNFSAEGGQLQAVLCAIRATFAGAVDYVTVKIGKTTHRVDQNADGMIRIRTSFRDSEEAKF